MKGKIITAIVATLVIATTMPIVAGDMNLNMDSCEFLNISTGDPPIPDPMYVWYDYWNSGEDERAFGCKTAVSKSAPFCSSLYPKTKKYRISKHKICVHQFGILRSSNKENVNLNCQLIQSVVARTIGEEIVVRRNIFGQVENFTASQLFGVEQFNLVAVNFAFKRERTQRAS